MKKNYCIHPGNMIKAILLSINKKQNWLANEMKTNKIIISDIIRGKRNITSKFAYAFENATGFSAEVLLEQQNKYELFCLQNNKPRSYSSTTNIINDNINENSKSIEIYIPGYNPQTNYFDNFQLSAA